MNEVILLLFLAWFILFIGFKQKDFTLATFSGFFLMSLGVYFIVYRIFNQFLDFVIAIIHFWSGFYVITRGSVELLKTKPEQPFSLFQLLKKRRKKK